MGEIAKKSDTESAIAKTHHALELAQKDIACPLPKIPDLGDFAQVSEDFLDPNHPLYGTMDENGRRIPGWIEQITIR